MANLLRFVVGLVTDEAARAAFRADPDGELATVEGDPDSLTGEDVDAVLVVVRGHVGAPLADQIHGASPSGTEPGESPRDAVIRHLITVCDSVEATTRHAATDGQTTGSHDTGSHDTGSPASGTRRLWAVDGAGTDDDAGDSLEPNVDPTHPAVAGGAERPGLAAVPEPEGGFAFDALELVRLVDGLPDDGIEPGALATVIARHPSLRGGIDYEIEIADDDGARRYLGVVPASALERA